ncbi:MAG TPA: hypothetical protein VNO52_19020 [Methylomirabilota bacterium]|nr:hypothetical protein [Methylomirabilota bacterium]
MKAAVPEPTAVGVGATPPAPDCLEVGEAWHGAAHPVRPRAERYTMLSLLWVFPSFGALFILGRNADQWLRAPSVNAALRALRLEDWLAMGLLALHAWFIARAVWWRRHATPRMVVATEPSPAHGLHKLR